ncbi:MAG TPA: T9SS type A sorting domain-containing protein [Candidatus Cloacimonetes bacterium]|nr:T9SS type A sorting domain-containing protein [Candidatus Cloacimonadota bacterium]
MKKIFTLITIITLSLIMVSGLAWAENENGNGNGNGNETEPEPEEKFTNPEALTLPASYVFPTDHESTTYPTGMVGWQIGTSCGSVYKICPPTNDKPLFKKGTGTSESFQVYNYKGKIGFLNTDSNDLSIAFAVNTTEKSNIRVKYDIMTIRSPLKRVNMAALQYRIGKDDNTPFITIPESEYIPSDLRQVSGTEPLKTQTFSILLPPECNNQSLVQLRFVGRDMAGSTGIRSSFAINELSIKESQDAYLSMVPSSISGLTYDLSYGPSTAQSIKLNAINLTDNEDIELQVEGDFEISLSEGADYGDAITLSHSSGYINETYIYVRLKDGLERGYYPGSITFNHENKVYPTKILLSGKVEEPLGPGYLVNFEGEDEINGNIKDGKIKLSGLDWEFNDAVIRGHVLDYKEGLRAACLNGKAESSLIMLEDEPNGLGTLRFYYGRHSTHQQVDWKVEYSRDQGATWIQIGELFTCPANDLVQEFRETVDVPGDVRIRINRGVLKYPGGSHGVLCIDDIFLSDYDGEVANYDILPNQEVYIGAHTPTEISGDDFFGANIISAHSEDFTAFPNAKFIPETRGKWELFGNGAAAITLNTENQWFAWVDDGNWNTIEGPFEDEKIHIAINETGTIFEFMTGSGDNPSLPVELSSFTVALNNKGKPIISWTTQSETAVNGFYIYRGTNNILSDAILVSNLIPATNSSLTHSYSFEDTELSEEGTYYYWLNISDLNGHEGFHGPVKQYVNMGDEDAPQIEYQTGFKSIYPNPFNPSANIAFELAEDSEVKIKVYNTRGQLLRSFAPFKHNAGYGSIIWDGKDDSGKHVSTGMYLFRMNIDGKSYHAKALMLK